MDWLYENFQIIALVLIGFAGWIKSRMESKNGEQEPPEESYDEGEVFIPEEEWQQVPSDPSVPPPLVWTQPPPILTAAADFEAAGIPAPIRGTGTVVDLSVPIVQS